MTGIPRGPSSPALAVGLVFGLSAGCRHIDEDPPPAPRPDAAPVMLPAQGGATTLDIASWNIEWFGDPSHGPSYEALQLQHVRDVVASADIDLWGFVEVVDAGQWSALERQLPGYTGFLANDPRVVDGPAHYSGYDDTEQKVGILYKRELATVLDARVILTDADHDFAGRPPLQVTLRVTLNGTTDDLVIIVLHAKCCSDDGSWQRRANAATALKAYLDAAFPTQKVWVIGDFNDDLDASIAPAHASPYAGLVADPARYEFPTHALSLAGVASTVNFPSTIDHHLNTDDSHALYIAGSAAVYRVDRYLPDYGRTTSDHYPVLTRYRWGAAAP